MRNGAALDSFSGPRATTGCCTGDPIIQQGVHLKI